MSKFDLGQVVATPGALRCLEEAEQGAAEFLHRHNAGDWGDLCEGDKMANEAALVDGSRLFSKYHTKLGVALWVISEAVGDDGKRGSTCVLLPEEY